ncbi:ATP/GTP-binding protein [Pseudomonadota bacterium]
MNERKILIVGPVGAGKTTAVKSIGNDNHISTDVKASDVTAYQKKHTTVAMDYTPFVMDNGERVHVYGTPGQERFNFMWDILGKNALGIVLLLNNTRENPLHDLKFFVNTFKQYVDESQLMVGITRSDLSDSPAVHDYRSVMQSLEAFIPIYTIDARKSEDVAMLINSLTCADQAYTQSTEMITTSYDDSIDGRRQVGIKR